VRTGTVNTGHQTALHTRCAGHSSSSSAISARPVRAQQDDLHRQPRRRPAPRPPHRPVPDGGDLYRLAPYQAACRLVTANGANTPGFTLATRPPPPPVPGRAGRLRADARDRGLSQADRDRQAKRRRYQAAAHAPSGSLPALPGSCDDR